MMRRIVKYIPSLIVMAAILLMALAVNIWFTWQGFKKIQSNYQAPHTQENEKEPFKKKFVLKKNNKILESDLKRLLPFLDISQSTEDWWKEQIDSGLLIAKEKIWRKGFRENVFEVTEDMEFDFDQINDCSLPQCYQKRIAFFDVPPALWRGLIGVEDERFLTHKGVDPVALLRALWVDLKELRLAQGGSTITQQVTRNLYLGLEKSFSRKWNEILFSIFMEYELSKEDILQAYFNEVFWGSLGQVRLQGVYAASVFYFGKKPADLTPYEVAILIAMLKGPNYFHPLRNTERVKGRANLLLTKLIEMKLVAKNTKPWTNKEWNNWQEWLKQLQNDRRLLAIASQTKNHQSQIPFYEEYLLVARAEQTLSQIKNMPQMKEQDMAYKILVEDLACVYADENKVGPETECPPVFRFYSKQERDINQAFEVESHQIGSLLKPIVYRGLMSFGANMQDEVSTLPLTLNLTSGPWSPTESKKEDLPDEITLRMALQKSKNIPVTRLSSEVGFDKLEEYLFPFVPKLLKPLGQYPAQILGSIELSFSEISQMYEKFIKDECFDLLQEKIDENTSPLLVLSHPDETTIASASSEEMKQKTFFGKTGTSNKANDNWFVGFDGRHLFVIWIGNERKEEAYSLELSGAWYSYKVFEDYALYRGSELLPLDCSMFQAQVTP